MPPMVQTRFCVARGHSRPLHFFNNPLTCTAPQGWHYELDTPEDELAFKGVVFHEMKGVYSSPDSMFYRWEVWVVLCSCVSRGRRGLERLAARCRQRVPARLPLPAPLPPLAHHFLAPAPTPNILNVPTYTTLAPPGSSSRRCSLTTRTATTAAATPRSSRTSPLSSSRWAVGGAGGVRVYHIRVCAPLAALGSFKPHATPTLTPAFLECFPSLACPNDPPQKNLLAGVPRALLPPLQRPLLVLRRRRPGQAARHPGRIPRRL